MNVLIKIFLTYSAISMFSALIWFGLSVYDYSHYNNLGVFLILWAGPMMLAMSLGLPILLYKLWNGEI